MNSNGIFTGHKRTTQLAGLGGCGCNGSCKGVGDIAGQSVGSLAVGVVVWTAGAIFLYYTFKSLSKTSTASAARA